jgi:nucleoside-diphosphate kinase
MEKTLAIIKPDAVKRNLVGKIIGRIESEEFRIAAMKMIKLDKEKAEGFYAVHRESPFFGELTEFMSSGPCVVMILDAEGAITKWREVMGATDPAKADSGTLRAEHGTTVQNNCTHGSDAPETAAFEISYFFNAIEMVPR